MATVSSGARNIWPSAARSAGAKLWQKDLSTYPNDYPGQSADSLEVRISPDGQTILEGDSLYVRGLSRADGSQQWSRFTKGVNRSIQLSRDGVSFYTQSSARELMRMSIADGRVLWTAKTAGSFAHQTGLKESPDGTLVGSMGVEGSLTMMDANTGQVLWSWIMNDGGHFCGFSGDSQVFVASTLSGTWGFSARTGDRLFVLPGAEGGSFARGRSFFILPNGRDSVGVYDTTGTRISNVISGLDWTTPNYYTALMTSDLNRLVLALREAQSAATPVLFFASLSAPFPSTPIGVTATASSGPNQITLSWTPSPGATSYRIRRGTTAGSTTFLTSQTGTTFIDTSAVTGSRYYYVVTAVNATGDSGDSVEVTAALNPLAYAAPIAGVTLITAAQLSELRATVNQLRSRYSLTPAVWSDPSLAAASTAIKLVHLTELRSALNDVYVAALRTPPVYTRPALTAGNSTLNAVDIAELRAAILAIF